MNTHMYVDIDIDKQDCADLQALSGAAIGAGPVSVTTHYIQTHTHTHTHNKRMYKFIY